MVLRITVTVRHQTSAHAGSDGKRPTSLKCPQLHAPAAECPSRCQQTMRLWAQVVAGLCPVLSHSALLSVTATHATALDAYLYWRRHSTRRVTSFRRYQLGHKGGENVANRCLVHGCHASFCLAGLQAFYAFTYWGECFLPVIRFMVIILFFFSTYVLF